MAALSFRAVTDLEECRALWEKFSPGHTIYQQWDWRYAHYRHLEFPVRFFTAYDGEVPVGILPLQYEPVEEYWEFFGGEEMEDNGIWMTPGYEDQARELLLAFDEPIWLDYLPVSCDWPGTHAADDVGFELDLAKVASVDDFIEHHLSGKLRKQIRASYRRVTESEVEVVNGSPTDLDKLFDLNVQTFGVESGFYDKYSKDIYRDLLRLSYDRHILKVVHAGATIAVTVSFLFHGVYYFYVVGYDRAAVKDLSAYLNLINIDEAIKTGATKIDFGYHDCGWKDRWGLARVEYREYYANLEPEDED